MPLHDRIRNSLTTAFAVARRFPASILLCLLGTACAWWAIEDTSIISEDVLFRVLFGCILGLPFTIALTLATESSPSPRWRLLPLLGLLPVAAFTARFVTLPDRLPTTEVFRLLALILASHFSVAVLPFLRRPGDDRYWAFQVRLFLRFLLGGLYAGVLFAGLALALLSFDRLLDLDINEKRYPQLWFIMAGVFHPLFTLGDIGRVTADSPFKASVGLRKFVQFVLLPLTLLYLAILYLYAGKIVLAWELPNGWVGLPVLILTVVGILGALLLHPWSADDDTPWVRRSTRGFFALTLPLTGLLALSIGVRVADYGVTEPRYTVVLLTAWLVGVCLIRTWQPHRDLRLIPASLMLIALFASFGPWGASAWSLRSQSARIESLVADLGLREADGSIGKLDATKADEATVARAQSLSDTLTYVSRSHGLDHLPSDVRSDHATVFDIIADLGLNRLASDSPDQRFLIAATPVHLTAPAAAQVVHSQYWNHRDDDDALLRHRGWLLTQVDDALRLVAPDGSVAELPVHDIGAVETKPARPYPVAALTFDFRFADGRVARIAFENVTLSSASVLTPRIISAAFLIALPIADTP